jgi:pantoate--beta-alanine ligase
VSELRTVVRDWRKQGLTVGLVPTMGALHDGHLTLIAEARRRADRVVASVFVNPTQFAAHEDLGDAAKGGPSQGLEGEFRPAMFGGVAVVVSKLLNQVQADVAVFGEKDWQQLMVVRRMAADLDIPTGIVSAPTLRDDHGLALSSRNAYLSEAELAVARRLNVILREAASQAAAGRPLAGVEHEAYGAILKAGFDRIDYVAIRNADDLSVFADGVVTGPARILVAATLGRTRLIDNMPV